MKDIGAGLILGGFIGEIPLGFKVENPLPDTTLCLPQHRLQLFHGPDVKLTLFALAVGILGRIKGPFVRGHVPQHIGENLLGRAGIKRIAGDLIGFQESQGRQGLIVEHFFEMGQEPVFIR